MNYTNLLGNFLRAGTLATALIAAATTAALADPPGYYFQDWQQPTQQHVQAAPPSRQAAMPNGGNAGHAGNPSAAMQPGGSAPGNATSQRTLHGRLAG